MSTGSFDLVVIGAGPGGYVAAIRAAQLGRRVALVERDDLGGVCLNWGCIPTKTLLHAAAVLAQVKGAGDFGIVVPDGVAVDMPRFIARSRQVAAQLRDGVGTLLRRNQVTVHRGVARILRPGQVEMTTAKGQPRVLEAAHILVATGARPRELASLPVDGQRVWNYRHALLADSVPGSLLVVGAGAIGMEFASFFATLGSQVTLVEAADRLLPAEDHEIAAHVEAAFVARGITVHCAVRDLAALPSAGPVRIGMHTASGPLEASFERVLVCAGVVGNVADLGLEGTRVRTTAAGCIDVGRDGATAEPGIHAIGDVCGAPMLAHKASHQGIACVERLFGEAREAAAAPRDIAACTYCEPQVASIGLTEAEARQARGAVKIGRFPFRANGKALAMGQGHGFVKLVFDGSGTGELLGAHMVGPEVSELIHGMALARGMEATEEDLMRTIYPHPTLSEAVGESALAAFDRAIHI